MMFSRMYGHTGRRGKFYRDIVKLCTNGRSFTLSQNSSTISIYKFPSWSSWFTPWSGSSNGGVIKLSAGLALPLLTFFPCLDMPNTLLSPSASSKMKWGRGEVPGSCGEHYGHASCTLFKSIKKALHKHTMRKRKSTGNVCQQ